ncbi:MAG: hypothetical protein M1503_03900 [Thaumarchaeota archaeon]|nr:hypothetical protein [Nitrososphaerota archaeon]MCL5317397.1 hypothetical protein [Nitrososphaerota archaeon]
MSLSDDDVPVKKRNLKTIVLVIAVVAMIGLGAVYSFQSKTAIQTNSQGLHAKLTEVRLVGSRLSATINNDGATKLDVSSVQISLVSVSCMNLPKKVAPAGSATLSCTATGAKTSSRYMVLVIVKDDNTNSTYTASTYVVAAPS